MIEPIKTSTGLSFRSSITDDGLILDWHKSMPDLPKYKPYPQKRFLMAAGSLASALVVELGVAHTSDVDITPAFLTTVIVGGGSASVEVAREMLSDFRQSRHTKAIEKQRAMLEPQFTPQRIKERAQEYDTALQIDSRTYELSCEASKVLLDSMVPVPGNTAQQFPARTIIAKYAELDNAYSYPKADESSNKLSFKSSVTFEPSQTESDAGQPRIRLNPAVGIARILQDASPVSGNQVIQDSFENIQDIVTTQAMAYSQEVQTRLQIAPQSQEGEAFVDPNADSRYKLAVEFLKVGATYIANLPSHQQPC